MSSATGENKKLPQTVATCQPTVQPPNNSSVLVRTRPKSDRRTRPSASFLLGSLKLFVAALKNLAGGHDTATPSPNRVVPATVENRPNFGEETRDARTSSSRSGETGDAYFSGSRQRQTRTSPTLLHPLFGIHGQRNLHQLLNSIFCLVLCASH